MGSRRPQVIALDVCGTLTFGSSWTARDCLNAKPNKANIERFNKLHKYHYIVIYTARRNELINPTIEWLDKNGIKYHAYRFEKMSFDCLIDDKAYNPDCKECMARLESKVGKDK